MAAWLEKGSCLSRPVRHIERIVNRRHLAHSQRVRWKKSEETGPLWSQDPGFAYSEQV